VLGVLRSSFLIVFVLFHFLGAAGWVSSPAFARDCSSLATREFYTHSDSIEWKVNLRTLCPVSNQGGLQTCWASSGATFLKPLLVRAGLMKANQDLSLDYYSAVVMRAFAGIYKKQRGDIFMDEIGPYYSTEIYLTLLQTGIVFKDEFRFPKIERTSRSGKTYTTDIRTSVSVQEDFIDELNEAKRSKKKGLYEAVLDDYLGNPAAVTPRPVPESVIEAHRPRLLVTQKRVLNEILEENLSSTVPTLVDPSHIEDEVKRALDSGNPVLITVSKLDHFRNMRNTGARGEDLSAVSEETDVSAGEHAITLIGYGTRADGSTWYLLQNNSGKKWGTQGTIAVSGAFLRTEIDRFFILSSPHSRGEKSSDSARSDKY